MVLKITAMVAILELRDGLDDNLAEDTRAPADIEHPLEVHQLANVAELLQADVHRHRQTPVIPMPAAVVHQAGEQLREKQGAQKLQRRILSGDAAEVGAGLFPWQRQINFIVGCDLVHQGILEHGQPVAQANGDIAPDLPVGQLYRGQSGKQHSA